MNSSILLGFFYILAAAVCGGAYAFPHKYVRTLKWETLWPATFFLGMIVIPLIMIRILVPSAFSVIKDAGLAPAIAAAVFGAMWGLGCVTFSIGVTSIGLALGFSLIMGVNTAAGSLIPLITAKGVDFGSTGVWVVIAGIAACLLGVAVCGYAGILKERATMKEAGERKKQGGMVKGIIVCVASGVCSAGIALGFDKGKHITEVAKTSYHIQSTLATLPIWMPIFCGGFVVVLLWCGTMQLRSGSYRQYREKGALRDLGLAVIMASLLYGAIVLSGFGMDRLSVSVGWAVNMCASILTANCLGFATGEWKASSRRSLGWMFGGLAILISAMVVLGVGKSMMG